VGDANADDRPLCDGHPQVVSGKRNRAAGHKESDMNRNKTMAVALTMFVAVYAGQARASNVSFLGVGNQAVVSITHNGNTYSVTAAELDINYNSVNYTAYCVDLDHTIQSAWTATNAPVTNVNGGKAAGWLYDHYAAGVTTNDQAAGLQVAIWEVVDDFGGSLNLTTGNFKLNTTGGIANAANAYLAALPADLTNYTTNSVLVWSGDSPRSQNLIVPEPGTMLGLMVGLPLMFIRRLCQRNAA
jgi:hypothetical protein